jgi:hypothetical protein
MKIFLKPKYEESTSNYYHFLIGYLLPIVDVLSNNTDKKVEYVVRDCGLMNTWFEKLKMSYDIKTINSEEFLIQSLGSDDVITFNYYDDPNFPNKPDTADMLKKVRKVYGVNNYNNIGVGILTRSFAKTNISGFTKKNNKSRFIKNIEELTYVINKKVGDCILLDTSKDDYQSVVNTYNNLSTLIGQWGAGLTNMIWMPSNSTIIEITSKDKFKDHQWDNCYKELAKLLNHNFISIEAQEVWDGRVDIQKILELVKN